MELSHPSLVAVHCIAAALDFEVGYCAVEADYSLVAAALVVELDIAAAVIVAVVATECH